MGKLSLTAYLAIALILSLGFNAFQLYRAGGAKPRAEAATAKATVKADQVVVAEQTARDTALDKVTIETKVDTLKGVAKVQEQARERAEAINRVPADAAGCDAPVGLPDLRPAVDQARAAAGE